MATPPSPRGARPSTDKTSFEAGRRRNCPFSAPMSASPSSSPRSGSVVDAEVHRAALSSKMTAATARVPSVGGVQRSSRVPQPPSASTSQATAERATRARYSWPWAEPGDGDWEPTRERDQRAALLHALARRSGEDVATVDAKLQRQAQAASQLELRTVEHTGENKRCCEVSSAPNEGRGTQAVQPKSEVDAKLITHGA